MDWDKLGFGLMPTDYMYSMKCSKDGNFEQGRLSPYGNIELCPSAGVLNYGQVNMISIYVYINIYIFICLKFCPLKWLKTSLSCFPSIKKLR